MRNDNITNLRGYGDVANVKNDAKTLRDIFERQGTKFMIDCIAENIGDAANRFGMEVEERQRLIEVNSEDFTNALSERI